VPGPSTECPRIGHDFRSYRNAFGRFWNYLWFKCRL